MDSYLDFTCRRPLKRGQLPPQAVSKAPSTMGKSRRGSSVMLTCPGHLCARTVLMTLGHLQGTAGKRMLLGRSPGLVPDPSVTITLECQLDEIGSPHGNKPLGMSTRDYLTCLTEKGKPLGDGDIQLWSQHFGARGKRILCEFQAKLGLQV